MSEEQKALDPEIVEAQKAEVKKIPRLQYVFITLADGRRGVFAGPELITKAEFLLKPPVLVDLVFSEPKETTDVDNAGTVEQKT
jgi:hypothetical protein